MQLKKALRQRHERWRRGLRLWQVEARGRQVFERLLRLPFWESCGGIALYAAQAFEVPVAQLFVFLLERGKRLFFPVVEAHKAPLLAHVRAQEDLEVGAYGIFCPKAYCPLVEPADVELVVVPGVAFARNGARLGRGGGFYDRLLAQPGMRALRLGLCFEECLVESLPEGAEDQRMHWVVTDKQCVDCLAEEP
ncbi:MAG: 5-formyltetrahydrofolate cyclo-ligase [Cystobacterineae bacterium]|nr:5-formyltetrahydrofolate cyclo-ligase [Cystobacterineae bacterium]